MHWRGIIGLPSHTKPAVCRHAFFFYESIHNIHSPSRLVSGTTEAHRAVMPTPQGRRTPIPSGWRGLIYQMCSGIPRSSKAWPPRRYEPGIVRACPMCGEVSEATMPAVVRSESPRLTWRQHQGDTPVFVPRQTSRPSSKTMLLVAALVASPEPMMISSRCPAEPVDYETG
jgi:hypothetical protein